MAFRMPLLSRSLKRILPSPRPAMGASASPAFTVKSAPPFLIWKLSRPSEAARLSVNGEERVAARGQPLRVEGESKGVEHVQVRRRGKDRGGREDRARGIGERESEGIRNLALEPQVGRRGRGAIGQFEHRPG